MQFDSHFQRSLDREERQGRAVEYEPGVCSVLDYRQPVFERKLDHAQVEVPGRGLAGRVVRVVENQDFGPLEGSGIDRIQVREDVLLEFNEQGVVPVISPISIGPEGRFNVNADHAAGAIAGAVKAPRVVFVSNVSGILVSKKVVPTLTRNKAQKLIQGGEIFGGMIPKVTAALDALSQGAQEVIITDLRGLSIGSGTKFVH